MRLKVLLPFLLLLCIATASRQSAPSLAGSWRMVQDGPLSIVFVLSDGYMMGAYFEANRFIGAQGGTYTVDGKQLKINFEFSTEDSTDVGTTQTLLIDSFKNNKLVLSNDGDTDTYERMDAPTAQTPMAGLWRITGNIDDNGQVKTRQRTARKTLKLLTGNRFQWAAINPETKQFSGTAGGTYTFVNGKYTEKLEFFSRDDKRVGKSLQFDAELKGDDWYHRGQSSTGGKVSEVWSREK
ncbi:membrane or secreted protein [Larkinella rosea]|uniref:Membrane or secreted protein n=1 Tax=Larkinella rosea TaxID=2025312 RepID=A0A3P1C0D0_9BACT|nr:membrane or secreted protein [Larkinella rosea]RRB06513.1 membrane or secreted protein [Larkinella rosea]